MRYFVDNVTWLGSDWRPVPYISNHALSIGEPDMHVVSVPICSTLGVDNPPIPIHWDASRSCELDGGHATDGTIQDPCTRLTGDAGVNA